MSMDATRLGRPRARQPWKHHPCVCGHAGAASTCHRRRPTEAVEIRVFGPYACGAALFEADASRRRVLDILLLAMRTSWSPTYRLHGIPSLNASGATHLMINEVT